MKTAVVYWIRSSVHSDPLKEGYIGVAEDLEYRIARHKRDAALDKHANSKLRDVLLSEDYVVDIVYSGVDVDCYKKELELRPAYRIGWNIVPGGHGGSTIKGMKMSDEFRRKRSEYMKGKKIGKGNAGKPKTEEHKAKIAAAHKGKPKPSWTEERKIQHGLKMKARWEAYRNAKQLDL